MNDALRAPHAARHRHWLRVDARATHRSNYRTARRPRVVIAYKTLPSYRRDFFVALRPALARAGVALDLVHGEAVGAEATKRDAVHIPWAITAPNRVFNVGRRQCVWQPVLDVIGGADLVIVEQASRLLLNYVLLAKQVLGSQTRVALWGHGANLQAEDSDCLAERLKRRYSVVPHWWFAYTDGVRERVQRLGYPLERITVVQNAIDTTSLRASIASISRETLNAFYQEHRCTPGSTGIFLGSLYAEKRLDFLIQAAGVIAERLPSFTLLIAGDGPQRDVVEAAVGTTPYLRYLGRVEGSERAVALRAADVALMPGLVGLGILDSFAAQVPIVTTDVPYHSPEIEYLRSDENGICVKDALDLGTYASAALSVLTDHARRMRLRAGCRAAALRYTNEEMVSRFSRGVIGALGMTR